MSILQSPLKWTFRDCVKVLAVAVGAALLIWAGTAGHLDWANPGGWTSIQWAALGMNAIGLGILFIQQGAWFAGQEDTRDEVGRLRAEVLSLSDRIYYGPGLPVTTPEEQEDPTEGDDDPAGDDYPTGPVSLVDSAPPAVPTIVQRNLHGHTFSFRGTE